MKATFSVSSDVCKKIVDYVKEEQSKDGFNGFDIKNVSHSYLLLQN